MSRFDKLRILLLPVCVLLFAVSFQKFNLPEALATAGTLNIPSTTQTFTSAAINVTTLTLGGVAINVNGSKLNFLSTLESDVQTQINTKAPSLNPTFTGNVTMPGTGIWNSSGNVGIGTTVVNYKLNVNGMSYFNNSLLVAPTGTNGVYLGNAGMFSGDESGLYDAGGDVPLAVWDNAAQLARYGYNGPLTIDTSGKVGIGTTNPGAKLDVSGTGNFSGTVTATTFSGALTGHASLDLPLTGGTLTGDITTYRSASPTTGVIYLGSNSGTRYLYYNGSSYYLNGAGLSIGGALSGATTGSFSSTVTAPTFSGALSGNATTATTANNLVSGASPTVGTLYFSGVGGDSGQAAPGSDYRIYQAPGAWTNPYPDLNIAYHTGIKIGAYYAYGGTRFFNNSDMVTELFSVGNGDGHVRVANNLYVASTVTASSDVRYKTNILTLPKSTLEKVLNLRGVSFNWNAEHLKKNPEFPKTSQIGVIAQEVEKLFPEVVLTGTDGYKSVDYGRFGPILIEAVKEQQKEIDGQKKEINFLKSEVGNLQKEIDAIKASLKIIK